MKTLLISFLFSVTLLAQNAGKAGLSFLKMPADARIASLGETGLGSVTGPMSVFYNAGRLDSGQGTSVAFMHNTWMQSITSEVFAGQLTLFGQPIGVGLLSVNVPDIEIRTKPGEQEGTFTAHFTSVNIGTSFCITKEIKAGVTVKNLFENIYADDANGWAADVYASYSGLTDGLDIFVAGKNLGSMNTLRYTETELPASIALGAAYKPIQLANDITLTPAGEVQSYFSGISKVNVGGDFSFRKMISLRAGYSFAESVRKLSFGLGFNYDFVAFHYALLPAAEDFGTGHLISLQIDF